MGDDGDLDFRTAGIFLMSGVFTEDLFFVLAFHFKWIKYDRRAEFRTPQKINRDFRLALCFLQIFC